MYLSKRRSLFEYCNNNQDQQTTLLPPCPLFLSWHPYREGQVSFRTRQLIIYMQGRDFIFGISCWFYLAAWWNYYEYRLKAKNKWGKKLCVGWCARKISVLLAMPRWVLESFSIDTLILFKWVFIGSCSNNNCIIKTTEVEIPYSRPPSSLYSHRAWLRNSQVFLSLVNRLTCIKHPWHSSQRMRNQGRQNTRGLTVHTIFVWMITAPEISPRMLCMIWPNHESSIAAVQPWRLNVRARDDSITPSPQWIPFLTFMQDKTEPGT